MTVADTVGKDAHLWLGFDHPASIQVYLSDPIGARKPSKICTYNDDDCFYYHSWRNDVVIAFETLSSFLT